MYATEHPNATSKEIATTLGLPIKLVYSAMYVAKKTKKRKAKPTTKAVTKPAVDLVNHPPHYTSGGIETIDFIEAKKLNYNLGNVVKYITRAGLKGARKQDLEKAMWYLRRELSQPV
jgi:hypothetical protein